MKKIKTAFRKTRQKVYQLLSRYLGRKFTLKYESILIIAPHPDDEIFVCGGLITKAVQNNADVHVAYMTSGNRAHSNCCSIGPKKVGIERKKIAVTVAEMMSADSINLYWVNCPDGKIPEQKSPDFELVQKQIADIIEKIQPNCVFCPHARDSWRDHELTEKIVRVVLQKQTRIIKLYYYCVWFWLNLPFREGISLPWSNSRVLDIQDAFSRKQMAIKQYLEPLAPCGNPYSGKLPADFLMAFDWEKELYFEANIF